MNEEAIKLLLESGLTEETLTVEYEGKVYTLSVTVNDLLISSESGMMHQIIRLPAGEICEVCNGRGVKPFPPHF